MKPRCPNCGREDTIYINETVVQVSRVTAIIDGQPEGLIDEDRSLSDGFDQDGFCEGCSHALKFTWDETNPIELA